MTTEIIGEAPAMQEVFPGDRSFVAIKYYSAD